MLPFISKAALYTIVYDSYWFIKNKLSRIFDHGSWVASEPQARIFDHGSRVASEPQAACKAPTSADWVRLSFKDGDKTQLVCGMVASYP